MLALKSPTHTPQVAPEVLLNRLIRVLVAFSAAPASKETIAALIGYIAPLSDLVDSMPQAMAVKRLAQRGTAGRRGPLPRALIVNHESLGPCILHGIGAAVLYSGRAYQTLSNAMAHNGTYAYIDTIDSKEWCVTIRRATPAEIKELA